MRAGSRERVHPLDERVDVAAHDRLALERPGPFAHEKQDGRQLAELDGERIEEAQPVFARLGQLARGDDDIDARGLRALARHAHAVRERDLDPALAQRGGERGELLDVLVDEERARQCAARARGDGSAVMASGSRSLARVAGRPRSARMGSAAWTPRKRSSSRRPQQTHAPCSALMTIASAFSQRGELLHVGELDAGLASSVDLPRRRCHPHPAARGDENVRRSPAPSLEARRADEREHRGRDEIERIGRAEARAHHRSSEEHVDDLAERHRRERRACGQPSASRPRLAGGPRGGGDRASPRRAGTPRRRSTAARRARAASRPDRADRSRASASGDPPRRGRAACAGKRAPRARRSRGGADRTRDRRTARGHRCRGPRSRTTCSSSARALVPASRSRRMAATASLRPCRLALSISRPAMSCR